MKKQEVTTWLYHAANLEDLQERIEFCFDNVPNWLPYLVPTFGGTVPDEDGVFEHKRLNEEGRLESVGNNYMFGYLGECQFGVMSWDEDRLLVLDEKEHNFHIVIRSQFFWFGGSNDNFKQHNNTEQPQDIQTKAEFEHYDRTKPVEETTVEELKATIEEWKRQGGIK